MLAVTLMASCKQSPKTDDVDTPQQPALEATLAAPAATDEAELTTPAKEQQESYFDRKAGTSRNSAARPAGTQATGQRQNGKAETIYVETDGAQGRVWGHVTMRGDRGTGTIHDWDENTLAVSVTRHGNELFAVDQNSRQYVFKLKQNKTQE